MKKVLVIIALCLFSSLAVAAPKNCPPGHQNIGSCAGQSDPYGGDFDNSSNAVGIGVGVGVGIASSESNANANSNATAGAIATGGNATGGNANAVGIGGNANATGGAGGNANAVGIGGTGGSSNANIGDVVATVGDVSNSNTVNATVGDVTNTNTVSATGGDGGSGGTAVAAAVVETGAVQVAEGAVSNNTNVNYEYRQVRQAPSIGQGSFAISGCGVAGNIGGSNTSGAAFLGLGWTPAQCYDFMLAQAYQAVGETKAACEVLNKSKAGQRAARRGIKLPDCEPQYVVVEVPAEVDMSQYATKEALDRAFIRSQQSK